jgi:hypothetical protein
MTFRRRYELARCFIAEKGLVKEFREWVVSRKQEYVWVQFAEFKNPVLQKRKVKGR